jgi:hypothetical protein
VDLGRSGWNLKNQVGAKKRARSAGSAVPVVASANPTQVELSLYQTTVFYAMADRSKPAHS